MKIRCAALLLLVTLGSVALSAEPLSTPEGLHVTFDGEMFRGRWTPVPGASGYQVWTRLHGGWRFDEREFWSVPFTSSFELPGDDDRIRFRVRAVAPDGSLSEFSRDVAPVRETPEEARAESSSGRATSAGRGGGDFDPDAPPPEVPTGLFAVWEEGRTVRLVWSESPDAVKYAVEEQIDGRWTAPAQISFPRKTTALIEDRPMPGPYVFRVRAVGKNGRASQPSRPTTLSR